MGKYPTLRSLIIIFISGSIGFLFDLPFYFVIAFTLFSLLISLTKSTLLIKYLFLNLSIGLLLSGFINQKRVDYPNKIIPAFDGIAYGKISEILTNKPDYSRILFCGKIDTKFTNKPIACKLILVIFKDDSSKMYMPGDELVINANLKAPQKKQLKNDFPERQYLNSLNAQFYAITNSDDVFLKKRTPSIKSEIYSLKRRIQSSIDNHFSERVSPVVKGILTGDRNYIDKDIKGNFAKTGTSHVLAISGLHVGIIALIVYALIGFIENRFLKLFIFSLLIWSFIVFTGLQNSAIRAGLMATLYFGLIVFGRRPKKFNILFTSIFIFIIFSPEAIFSISFLLSVSAVLGIFLFYDKIYFVFRKAFKIDNYLTKFISASIAISISATLLSVLFTAYYFNIFNIIYPISNLLIVPIISLSTAFGIFYLTTLPLENISSLFASSIELFVNLALDINNYFIQFETLFLTTNNTILISTVSTVLIIYILNAHRIKRKLLSRITISVILIIPSIILINRIEFNNEIQLLQREQFAALIDENENKATVVVIDRKKYDFLKGDYSFVNYLKKFDTVNFYKTGMVSIDIHDRIKYDIHTNDKFININDVNRLLKDLNYDKVYHNIKY